jgi:hypothetical protein
VGDIINLRRARKRRERTAREQAAAEQRRRFGRTKAEKLNEAADKDRAERALTSHRREDDEP